MAQTALKRIDQRTEYLIYGHNREIMRNIPRDINEMCLLYYFEYEEWDKQNIHKEIELKSDNVTIEKINGNESVNAYLLRQIDSGINEYKFKVIKLKKNYPMHWNRITVGVLYEGKKYKQLSPPLKDHLSYRPKSKQIYCNQYCRNRQSFLKVGDIVTIIIDMNERTINAKINDIQYSPKNSTKIYPRSIKGEKYRVGVNLFVEGDSIQLL